MKMSCLRSRAPGVGPDDGREADSGTGGHGLLMSGNVLLRGISGYLSLNGTSSSGNPLVPTGVSTLGSSSGLGICGRYHGRDASLRCCNSIASSSSTTRILLFRHSIQNMTPMTRIKIEKPVTMPTTMLKGKFCPSLVPMLTMAADVGDVD